MGIRLGSRRARRGSRQAERRADPSASAAGTPPAPEADHVIDLRDTGSTARIAAAPMMDLGEELRARRARDEALADLRRLRTRHWSPERIIEEGRIGIDFWEHHEADPYAVLSLLPGATLEEVAAARRRIAQQCHPDRLGEDADQEDARRRMAAANAAYDRLRRALRTV
jgi:DnaJ domain